MTTPRMSNRFNRLLVSDRSSLTHLLTLAGLSLSMGFFFGNADVNTNYQLIKELAPTWLWGTWFLCYSLFKIYGNLYRLWFSIRLTSLIISAWSWTYMLLSFVFFDSEPYAPTELLLAVPALCEVWLAASLVYSRNYCRRRDDRKR